MGDLPKWKESEVRPHYNGWLTQKKNDGLIVMGDLPRKMMKGGLIIMGDPLKWKIEKMWSGRVIMGDLPRWKMVVSLWWVTYPEKMMFFF